MISTTTVSPKSQVVQGSKPDLLDIIEMKKMKERKISLEIPKKERLTCRDSLVHCRNIKKQPLNTLVSFEFPQDQECLSGDIAHIRKVSHYLRMIFQRDGNRESLIIWTRTSVPGSGIEKCKILVHVPDTKIVEFTKQVIGWTFEKLAVEPVDPEKRDRYRNERYVSLFEEIFAATDHLTRVFIKDVYTEHSGPLRGPRTFNSYKLNKTALIKHRREAEKQKQLELFKGFCFDTSGTASIEK